MDRESLNSIKKTSENFASARQEMVERQIKGRGLKDSSVLKAMLKVPRHEFVPQSYRAESYADSPLPIGNGQTISQPYIVALMTELLQLKGGEKVLEIGTGCGYQTAILAEIAESVYSIEILEPLCKLADSNLKRLKYNNIHLRCGDGYIGWPTAAPFDGIIVTAAPDHIPKSLTDQLKMGGILIIPVGDIVQELITIRKTKKGLVKKSVLAVRFVPMTGKAQK